MGGLRQWGTVELPVAAPDNGVWAGTGVESGLFNASAAAEGTHTLTYAVIDEAGCANEAELPTEVVAPIEFDLGPKVHACERSRDWSFSRPQQRWQASGKARV